MAVAVALWSLTVNPGEPSVITPPADLRITNVALGDEVADENSRTTVKLTYRAPGAGDDSEDEEDDEEDNEEPSTKVATAVLCSLTFGKIEQTTVDVVLGEDEEYLFEVVGKNTVHLTGNYIDQRPPDQDPYSDDESEDAYDLRDVSSDVEIDPDELDVPSDDEGRFEEIDDNVEEAPKQASKKRPRESDAMDTDEQGEKLSKSQKKKQKKQKGADGTAVEAPSSAPEKSEAKAEKKKGKTAEPTEKSEKAEKKKDKKDKKDKDKDGKKGETKVLGGGVTVVEHKVGTGRAAKKNDTVSMRYIGKLQSGKVFDKNVSGPPFKFSLGKGEVIKGWDIGIEGMQEGGERLLTIPAPMAYGKKPPAGSGIPSNSTLTFEVKLLSIN